MLFTTSYLSNQKYFKKFSHNFWETYSTQLLPHTTPRLASINLCCVEKQKTTLTILISASQWQNRVACRFEPHFSHHSKTYEALYRQCWSLRNKYLAPSNVTSYCPKHPEAFPKWDRIVRQCSCTVRDHLWGYWKLKPFLLKTSHPCPVQFSNEFCNEC